MAERILELKNITKIFPGVKALDGVTFTLDKGEVHVFLGENGAGKSTLMKVLAGVYKPDGGEIVLKGQTCVFRGPRDAQEKHISIIYQEFNLVPNLTVGENIYLGREPLKNGFIDRDKMYRDAKEALKLLNVEIDVYTEVKNLGVAHQQLVEVAKALSIHAEILIMDEPTATLSEIEITELFKTIRHLQAQGVSIIYISHRLSELREIGDRITVIRDGKTVGTRDAKTTQLDELITMMVGRELKKTRTREKTTAQAADALRVASLNRGKKLRDINFYIKKGEIVGFSGLVGSGRTELANAIYGIDPIDSGEIYLFERNMSKRSPARCIKHKMGFIPENRKEDGLSLRMSIRENVVAASLRLLFKSGLIRTRVEEQAAQKLCAQLKLNTTDMSRWTQNLSGGNQQKVVLAKWLCTHSNFLVFDEPTRGIDVGAKEEIHNLIKNLAESGIGIMMISSDLPEILNLSDRIYVMREGAIVAELKGEGTTQEDVIAYASGGRKAD